MKLISSLVETENVNRDTTDTVWRTPEPNCILID